MISYLRLRCRNDVNGNPRRIYLVYWNGNLIKTIDEGYCGDSEVKKFCKDYLQKESIVRGSAWLMGIESSPVDMGDLDTTPRQYRELKKWVPNT